MVEGSSLVESSGLVKGFGLVEGSGLFVEGFGLVEGSGSVVESVLPQESPWFIEELESRNRVVWEKKSSLYECVNLLNNV